MRLFIAVKPDDKILRVAEKAGLLLKDYGRIKVVKSVNMHITLAFLGEQLEKSLPNIKKSIDSVRDLFPVEVKFTKFSFFKKGNLPVVFFLKGESDEMHKVVNRLREELKRERIKFDEKKFVIHLTIGRIKSVKNLDDFYGFVNKLNENFNEYDCRFERPILYKSTLMPDGPVYKILYQ